jgi:hypothetical protein
LPGRKIPVARVLDIGFRNFLGIDEQDPLTKLHLLTLQGDHPLEQHHPVPGQTDGYYLTFAFLSGRY